MLCKHGQYSFFFICFVAIVAVAKYYVLCIVFAFKFCHRLPYFCSLLRFVGEIAFSCFSFSPLFFYYLKTGNNESKCIQEFS